MIAVQKRSDELKATVQCQTKQRCFDSMYNDVVKKNNNVSNG